MQLAALLGADVETDTAFAAVVLLDVEVHVSELRADALRHEPAVRIARRRVLDLDDIGALIGEHRAGSGDEHPLRKLEDSHALEYPGLHRRLSRRRHQIFADSLLRYTPDRRPVRLNVGANARHHSSRHSRRVVPGEAPRVEVVPPGLDAAVLDLEDPARPQLGQLTAKGHTVQSLVHDDPVVGDLEEDLVGPAGDISEPLRELANAVAADRRREGPVVPHRVLGAGSDELVGVAVAPTAAGTRGQVHRWRASVGSCSCVRAVRLEPPFRPALGFSGSYFDNE